MMATSSPARRVLKHLLPAPWRATLRRAFFEEGFHLYPPDCFSRYRPQGASLLRWLGYEARYKAWHVTRGRRARLERPIFVIGCPRSGTGISVRLLALHPLVANLSEVPDIWDPWHYRDFEADHHWTAADVRPGDAARLHARFEYHRRWHRRPRFVNKHPRSSVRIDYIRAVFPDAVFVHIIRDGRAVVTSMLAFVRERPRQQRARMPFCHPPNWQALVREDKAEQSALQWCAIVRHVLSKKAELGAAYHEIRYEELCEAPRAVLGAAFRFAGLRADDEVLARLPERLENRNYKWKQQLSLQQIETIVRVEAPLLEQLGYPL